MRQKEVDEHTKKNQPNKQRWNRKTRTENVKIYYKFDIIARIRAFLLCILFKQSISMALYCVEICRYKYRCLLAWKLSFIFV